MRGSKVQPPDLAVATTISKLAPGTSIFCKVASLYWAFAEHTAMPMSAAPIKRCLNMSSSILLVDHRRCDRSRHSVLSNNLEVFAGTLDCSCVLLAFSLRLPASGGEAGRL